MKVLSAFLWGIIAFAFTSGLVAFVYLMFELDFSAGVVSIFVAAGIALYIIVYIVRKYRRYSKLAREFEEKNMGDDKQDK